MDISKALRLAGVAGVVSATLVATLPAASAVNTASCFGKPATILGSPRDDRLVGTPRADVIYGAAGDDVIFGHDGNDRICGGKGNDRIAGRYGADLLDGGLAGDALDGGPGNDLLLGASGRDSLKGGDGRDSDTLVGGIGNDWLYGGDGSGDGDFVFGGSGDDYVDGGFGGIDQLYGGEGDDSLEGRSWDIASFEFSPASVSVDLSAAGDNAMGEGVDSLSGIRGVVGSRYDDHITEGSGNAPLRGGAGNDVISAGDGIDSVDGGPGDDSLDGGAGKDTVAFVDSPSGVTVDLSGTASGAGTDVLAGFEDVDGSYFDDHLTGTDDANEIYGSFGRNVVHALGGNDYITFAAEGDAGEGTDHCMNAFIPNCEMSGHGDPATQPFITHPTQRDDISYLDEIRGDVAGGIIGPRDGTILVALRRMTPDGCSWWSRGRFVVGGCGTPRYTAVGEAPWKLPVGRSLPTGTYLVRTVWKDRFFRFGCEGFFSPSCVEFNIP